MTATSEIGFSQAQLNFLKFVWIAFKSSKALSIDGDRWFDLFRMKDGVPTWEERVYTEFVSTPIRIEKGTLYAIQFIWTGNNCHLHQKINLHEPYFDEEIYIGENRDGGTDYGRMVYQDSIYIGPISWIQAARILYQMIGIPEKADCARFVELVKAL